jgi:uncharacterized protein (TIGR01244 family)
MAGLREAGFTSVVNLRLAGDDVVDIECSQEAAGLKYIHLPFSGTELYPELVEEFLSTVGDEVNQPAYIHCRTATRVAPLWVLGRVLKDGRELDASRRTPSRISPPMRRPASRPI